MKKAPSCYIVSGQVNHPGFPDRLRQKYKEWKSERKMQNSIAEMKKTFKATYKADPEARDYSMSDFDKLVNVGKGSFGRVDLVRNKRTCEMSALKIIDMLKIEDETSFEHLMNEKRILSSIRHPFIVGLKSHFKDEARLYLEMEYYPGGDLYSYIKKNGKCSDSQARFYGAQILMAIEFMHSIGVVHRDLKPDNIMLNSDGYLKIVDFGFAIRAGKDGMSTLCGTPHYMAPELYILSTAPDIDLKYSDTVEWWTYGVIMYTLIIGKEPFRDGSFRNCVKIIAGDVDYPPNLPSAVRGFLGGLLQPSICERLGCGKKGSKEIRNHEWFSGTDWRAIFNREVAPPYLPNYPEVKRLSHGPESGEVPAYEGDYVTIMF